MFTFDNTYVRDLEDFYVRWQPTPVPKPGLVCLNESLARELGGNPANFSSTQGIAFLAGNAIADGAEPIAQAYAGHQFGHFSPQLGDGRALLLGEVINTHGQRRDIALKGSGRTPFSRNGDGKCALGPALREYLISEAMHALGIPTTRSLAVVTTGEMVRRDQMLPGAILVRVAASHIRIGTFEYFAAHHGPEHIQQLANYVITRHYPVLTDSDNPYLELLKAVCHRQAELVARWLGIGFIHGVMNTDNMTLSGETIDYGPCAFMEAYDPATVFSSIDQNGRYAYGQQANIARWNLARLAETLLPLIDTNAQRAIEKASEVINAFAGIHDGYWLAVFRAKLGLDTHGDPKVDRQLIQDFLDILKSHRMDFTNGFRACYLAASGNDVIALQHFAKVSEWPAWHTRWQTRQAQRNPQQLTAMCQANPCYIPRNHLVEAALTAAVEDRNLAPFMQLLSIVQSPFEDRPSDAEYAASAPVEFTDAYQTFCGT